MLQSAYSWLHALFAVTAVIVILSGDNDESWRSSQNWYSYAP